MAMSVVTRPETGSATSSAARWAPWIRAAIGVAILAAIVAVVGAEPFVRGLAAVSPAAIGAAALLAAAATAAAAWRWRIRSSDWWPTPTSPMPSCARIKAPCTCCGRSRPR